MTISGLHRRSTDELEPDDNQDILDADDVAAELLGDADEPPTVSMRRTSLPPSAAAHTSVSARLAQTEAELCRLQRQMRARDAYLAELEQALRASTSKLEASGIGSVEDAHRLFGRLRGQAFRIAELESELRGMEQQLARVTRLLPR